MSHAQGMPTLCSCSPTVFTFVLSLDQTCYDNDIASNTGIDGTFCFTEEGVAAPEVPEPIEEEAVDVTEEGRVRAPWINRALGTPPEPVEEEEVEVDAKVPESNAMSKPAASDGSVRGRRRAAHVAPTPKGLALMPLQDTKPPR